MNRNLSTFEAAKSYFVGAASTLVLAAVSTLFFSSFISGADAWPNEASPYNEFTKVNGSPVPYDFSLNLNPPISTDTAYGSGDNESLSTSVQVPTNGRQVSLTAGTEIHLKVGFTALTGSKLSVKLNMPRSAQYTYNSNVVSGISLPLAGSAQVSVKVQDAAGSWYIPSLVSWSIDSNSGRSVTLSGASCTISAGSQTGIFPIRVLADGIPDTFYLSVGQNKGTARCMRFGYKDPEAPSFQSATYGYLEYRPANYASLTAPALAISLPGQGEIGSGGARGLALLPSHGPFRLVSASGMDFPGIVLCPQTPKAPFDPNRINLFISQVVARYRIDPSRVYLLGYSAGAGPALQYAHFCAPGGQRLAAMVIMSTSNPLKSINGAYDSLNHVPLWCFQSFKDLGLFSVSEAASLINGVSGAVANRLNQTPLSSVMSNYPNMNSNPNLPAADIRTAVYNTGTGWTWSSGIPPYANNLPPANPYPIFTVYPGDPYGGDGHVFAADNAFESLDMWTWLWQQVRPNNPG